MLGVMVAAALPQPTARRLVSELLRSEKDPEVRDLILRYHGMK